MFISGKESHAWWIISCCGQWFLTKLLLNLHLPDGFLTIITHSMYVTYLCGPLFDIIVNSYLRSRDNSSFFFDNLFYAKYWKLNDHPPRGRVNMRMSFIFSSSFFYFFFFFRSGDCLSKPLNVTIVNVISCLIWSDVVEDFKNVKTKYKN